MSGTAPAERSDAAQEMPSELGIKGLQPRRPASGNLKSQVAGMGLIVSMIAVIALILWSYIGPKDKPAKPPIAVASDQVQPPKFDVQREGLAAAVVATPASSPSGSADVSSQPTGVAQPIGLRNPGQGPVPTGTGVTPVVPSIAGGAAPATVGAPTYPATAAGYTPPPQRRDDSPFVTSPAGGWPQSASGGPGSNLYRTTHVPQNGGSPLGTATANLEQYQTQLDGMVRQLQTLTDQAQGSAGGGPASAMPPALTATPAAPVPAAAPATRNQPLFGQLERSNTPRAHATMLGARSYVVPKGVLFQCALKTRVVSAVSGFVGCQVQRPVYSDDGKVVLIERGSHLDGEYRIVQVRPGLTRIPILWTRVRTPHGVTVDLDSPATGALGDSGITGEVNNRWMERIGAALLLSLIDDAIKLQISENTSNANATVVLPNTAATTSRLAEKVLDSTINIPPLITAHQGSVVGVYVSRDLDFSGVYRLEAR